ncbi:SAM-dependent methyltransferase [Nocardiopsis sp. DSM 44743]|uniref:SAM-dependent methyltransferase n=1 Tax=Nocardiopsis lambiniae TaxID=3075539 RepID=A0ABU2M9L9_9ACTN|nr:SAM-dependent methyltransferase [Nocardiopsis sp. DSM 44743]MDT0328656.1 SAM-dependent methyltransferase [Nocardiopsis sp. DSM 44743]
MRDPVTLLREAAGILGDDEPIGLVLLGILFPIPDDEVYDVVRALVEALPSGRHVILTHATNEATGEAMEEAVRRWNASSPAPITLWAPAEIERFPEGLEPVDPGPVSIPLWRPEPSEVGEPRFMDESGVVARTS